MKTIPERLTRRLAPLTRTFALLIATCAFTGVWATDYTFSNVDSGSLASWSDPSYGTQTFQFKLNAPGTKLAVGDFPSSGYVQLTSISLSARSDQSSYKTATKAVLTNDKTSESYTASVTYNEGAFVASMDPDKISDASRREWTRMEVLMTFSTAGVLVDTDATYTLTFKNASNANVTMGYSVVKNDSLSIGWTPAMRIYGRTPSGSMEMPSSLIPSSGGMALPSTVTVADAANYVFSAGSITIGNSGIQATLASALDNQTVMLKATIPSSASRLVGWTVRSDVENYTSYSGSQFEQHYLSNGSVAETTYGTSAWTNDGEEHWLAVSYVRANQTTTTQETSGGTRTYLDGVQKISNTDLKWGSIQTSKVTVGGTAANTTDAATGMVITDLQIYNQGLSAQQIAKVTEALNSGWTVNAAGTTLSTDTLRELPNHANVQAKGSLTVAADGTYSASGLTEVKVLAGGSYNIGTARPTISGVATGGTLAVAPTVTVSEQIEGYEATETLTVTGDIDGTVTLGGVEVTPVVADGTATLTAVVPSNPTYTGDSWWWDYEFNGNVTSVGSDKGGMTQEGGGTPFTTADASGNQELYFQKTPYRSATFNSKSELTAIMYCAPGNYANTVLVGFGSTTANDQKAIALVTGANPSAGEMKLVLTDGHNGGTGTVTELADLTAVGATTTKHLYAFVMDRITEDETTKTRVRVYLDGKVKAIYKHNGTLTLSNGFQIGSLHGGVAPRSGFNTGLSKYPASGDSGTLDFLRISDSVLTDAAMAALAEEYPYNSQYGAATRAPISSANANFVAAGVWTQTVPDQADATQDAPNPNTNVTLSKDGSSDVSVAINLTENSAYESLTLAKEAGATGSLKLTSNDAGGKLVSAETSVLVDTTVPAGRVNLGVTSLADGVTLTIDPFALTIESILTNIGLGEVYEDVIISMALMGERASVVLDSTHLADLTAAGFTAELVYNPDNLSYTFKVTREAATTQNITVNASGDTTAIWAVEGNVLPLPAPASLPNTYTGTVTINNNSSETATTIATTFNGGKVKIAANSGPINFTGDRVEFDIQSNETLTLTGTVAVDEIVFTGGGTVVCSAANTLQGTVKGSATIQYPAGTLPVVEDTGATKGADFTNAAWTGTLVLANCGHLNSETPRTRVRVPFEEYGSANSFIKAPGFKGFAADAAQGTICEATLVIDPGTGNEFEFNHGWKSQGDTDDIYAQGENANFKFSKLSGTGKLILDGTTDYAQYIFCDVSQFTGDVLITYPGEGGRKSYLFGAPADYVSVGADYAANLVIMGNVAVAANKTWDIPAGVIISDGAALTLGSGSAITALSPSSRGTLSVPSGTATVSGVSNSVVRSAIEIESGATLRISDTAITELTLPADAGATYNNSGMLDLSGCTALADLYLVLGDSKTVDFSNIALPASCKTVYFNIGGKRDLTDYTLPTVAGVTFVYYAEETDLEYANGVFEATNVPESVKLVLKRKTGATLEPAKSGTTRSYTGGRDFAGAACWHEWDFEGTVGLGDTGMYSDAVAGTPITLSTVSGPAYQAIQVANRENMNAISSANQPYATGMTTFPSPWAAAVRCSMPATAGQVAISFGDATSGMLGLASGANNTVEVFNLVGGTYTTLARLNVESPSDPDNMHIYVFSVTEETVNETTKKYVSFYRDGEFIHKAEVNLGTITSFKVGGVDGDGDRDATGGFTDYVRLYNKVIDGVLAAGLSARRPFISQYPTYVRNVTGNVAWTADNAWENMADGTTTSTPAANSHVTVAAEGTTAMSVNLDANASYNTLIFARSADATGEAGITIGSSGAGKIGADMIVVRTPVTLNYGAIDFPDAMVGIDEGASLTFNFQEFPYDTVTGSTKVYVTGVVVAREYDATVDDRIFAVGGREPTWTLSAPTYESETGCYYVTITLDHAPGGDVFYRGGYWSGNENTFSVVNSQGNPTTVFEGDTVVIPADITGEDAYFDSTLPANVTKIKVLKNGYTFESGVDNAAILGGVEVQVGDGVTLNFGAAWHAMQLGGVKLTGPGAVNFGVDAAAASIAGDAAITVAAGKTLTLGTNSSTFTGSISGLGTVMFQTVNNSDGFDVGKYNGVGTIALGGFGTWFKSTANNTVNVTAALRLDGNVAISALSGDWTYTFAKITGTGDFTIPSDNCQVFTISNIEGYTGTLTANRDVTVSKISLAEEPAGGTKLLETSGAGVVTVSAVHVAGNAVSWPVVRAADGIYKASASYGGNNYRNMADAINAAGDDLAGITVWDTDAELPVGYEISGSAVAKAASTFEWNGGDAGSWAAKASWRVGVSEPARLPDSVDTVLFTSEATVTLPANTTVGTVDCAAPVTLNKDTSDVALTATSVVLRRADVSLTIGSGVTLSATPTTSVADGVVVSTSTDAGMKYSVVVIASSTNPDNSHAYEVTPPADVTSIDMTSYNVASGDQVVIPATVTNIQGVTAENLILKVTYNDGEASYPGILALDESGNVSLDGTKSVAVGTETVTVTPAVNGMASTTTTGEDQAPVPTFTIRALPGLYYVVKSGTSFDGTILGGTTGFGVPVQASGSTVSPVSPTPVNAAVNYYKIKVGLSAADATTEPTE